MLLSLYKAATGLGAPLMGLHLRARVRHGKEDPARLDERHGISTLQRPEGPLLWLHGASIGESLSLLPLIDRLLQARPTLHVLVTTGTVTSATLMAERLPQRAFHQFAPLDRSAAWQAFFDHWRPGVGCLIESEIWPHLILAAKRASLPLILINGRISARSASRWRLAGGTIRHLLAAFTLCLARSRTDAQRLSTLGAVDVRLLGDLKAATPPLPVKPACLNAMRSSVQKRPIWLAASTHPGEEEHVLAAHRLLRRSHPDLLTIIVPRQPERGGEIGTMFRSGGETVARRSEGELPDGETGIYLADTVGELGLFYRLARIAFIGGSLVPHGGHNPFEAARLGCVPLFGPHTGNFEEMTERLLLAGAGLRIEDTGTLGRTVGDLLSDPAALDAMAAMAEEVGTAGGDVLDRITEALQPVLDRGLGPAFPHEPDHARP